MIFEFAILSSHARGVMPQPKVASTGPALTTVFREQPGLLLTNPQLTFQPNHPINQQTLFGSSKWLDMLRKITSSIYGLAMGRIKPYLIVLFCLVRNIFAVYHYGPSQSNLGP